MQQFVRFASTSTKAASAGNIYLNKAKNLVNGSIYWSKVGLELGKYVWLKEGLSPPTVAQFKQVFTQDLLKFAQQARSASPQQLAETAQGWNKSQYIKGGALAIQLLGLFSLGEIIGRRHVYGYAKPETHH